MGPLTPPNNWKAGCGSRNGRRRANSPFMSTGSRRTPPGWTKWRSGLVSSNANWLTPNHFVRTADLEQAISQFITSYNQRANPIKWTYTVEQLEHKLGTHL